MDTFQFDAVARLFSNGMTRREALRSLVAGAAAVTAGGMLLSTEEAAVKREFECVNGTCQPYVEEL